MISMNIHDVSSVGISYASLSNSNSRTIRITTIDWEGKESIIEITLYASLQHAPSATEVLDRLPRVNSFRASEQEPA